MYIIIIFLGLLDPIQPYFITLSLRTCVRKRSNILVQWSLQGEKRKII